MNKLEPQPNYEEVIETKYNQVPLCNVILGLSKQYLIRGTTHGDHMVFNNLPILLIIDASEPSVCGKNMTLFLND